jgi:hypothetical protein
VNPAHKESPAHKVRLVLMVLMVRPEHREFKDPLVLPGRRVRKAFKVNEGIKVIKALLVLKAHRGLSEFPGWNGVVIGLRTPFMQ